MAWTKPRFGKGAIDRAGEVLISTGDEALYPADWDTTLMSSAIALREGKPIVPMTPVSPIELKKELREAVGELRVRSTLEGWAGAINQLPTARSKSGAGAFLLFLDTDANTSLVTPFSDEEGARASNQYLKVEKEIRGRPSAQAVLVSVQSVQALRSAFPNYFADTRVFIEAVKLATS